MTRVRDIYKASSLSNPSPQSQHSLHHIDHFQTIYHPTPINMSPRFLIPNEGQTIFGTRHFPDDALDLISCCALFTDYHPFQLANLFNGLLPSRDGINWTIAAHVSLQGVKASEIRALAWEMRDTSHPIWTLWSEKRDAVGSRDDRLTVKPLLDAGLPASFRYPERVNKLSWSSLLDAVLTARSQYPDRNRVRHLVVKPFWDRDCMYDEDRL